MALSLLRVALHVVYRMGVCASLVSEPSKPTTPAPATPADDASVATSTDRRIHKQLKEDANQQERAIKLLLLGAGECGKSTILKQMKILHKNGFTTTERVEARDLIYSNTLSSIQALSQAVIDLNIPVATPQEVDTLHYFLSLPVLFPSDEHIAMILTWYATPHIQQAMSRSNEFYLLDSAPYFLSDVQRTLQSAYLPTDADILHSRLATSGIIENDFVIDNKHLFKIIDVGGQRGERKKWIHCFDSVQAIMFIASLNEYDQVLAEDTTKNRLVESLGLFEGIISLPWFKNTAIILFLNKNDLFSDKIKRVDLHHYFDEYDGGYEYEEGLEFIKELFFSKNTNPNKVIYAHVTDATDTNGIAFVWAATKNIILQGNLYRAGLVLQ